jgi:hypothetical protein
MLQAKAAIDEVLGVAKAAARRGKRKAKHAST